jgi:hypothetical protein
MEGFAASEGRVRKNENEMKIENKRGGLLKIKV